MGDDGTQLLSYWRAMVRVCEPVLGSRDDAEDCASEALAAALADRGLDGVENPEAWLVTVAKRRATDVLRRRVRNRSRLLRLAGRCEVETPDVAERVADESEARWLSRRADELLSPPARAVLGVVTSGGTVDDAAAQLAMTRRSAESHLHRARLVLRAARVAVPAFLATLVRNGRRPAAATSVAFVTAAAFVPAIYSPAPRQAVPEARLAPVVVDSAARPAAPVAKPAVTRRVSRVRTERPAAPVVAPAAAPGVRRQTLAPEETLADLGSPQSRSQILVEDRGGATDPVGIVRECAERFQINEQRIGC